MTTAASIKRGPLEQDEIDSLEYIKVEGAMKSNLANLDAGELKERLRKVCELIEQSSQTKIAYHGSGRLAYVAIQFLLNQQCVKGEQDVAAPAFRARLKLTNSPTGFEKDLSNDTQIIDLHYFWLHGHRDCESPYGRRALGSDFDSDSAYRFVRTVGNTQLKLKLLGLDMSLGKRLCRLGATTLRTSADRDIQQIGSRRRAAYANALDAAPLATNTNKRLWLTLLLADEMLKRVHYEPNNERLATMAAMLTGEPIGPRNRLMDKLKSACAAFASTRSL